MFDHREILDKIEFIKKFFDLIGLKKIQDIPTQNWNLDSSYKFIPIKDNFTITYKNEERVLLSVNVFIVGGVHFMISGKMWHSISEIVQTDYDFKGKYDESIIFEQELRDWKIKQLL